MVIEETNLKTLFKLMDVKTLVAGIIPVVFGSVFSLYYYDSYSLVDMIILMIGIILIQSCANMINDLFDFKRGADGESKRDEKALASGEVSNKNVKYIVICFLLIDLLIAIYYSVTIHYGILIVGLIGAMIMYLYSAGKHPISYTPLGEVVAGVTMGFGIITTVVYIQSEILSIEAILIAIPTAIYIGTILLTNNISDQIGDKLNGRHTLPIIIGREKADILWQISCYMMIGISFVLFLLSMLPIEGLLLGVIIMPHKKIVSFRYIDKEVKNKGIMMATINDIGIKFHFSLIMGMLFMMYVKPFL